MDIAGVDKAWFKSTLDREENLITVLVVLTSVPVSAAEEGFDRSRAEALLDALRDYKKEHKIDFVEIVRGDVGQ